jgi:hypothetical protein
MKKILLIITIILSVPQLSNAESLVEKMQKKLDKALSGGGGAGNKDVNVLPSGGVNSTDATKTKKNAGGESGIGALCPGYAPYKQKDLAGSTPEQLVGKYFRVSADMEKLLSDGISIQHPGTLASFETVLQDIYDQEMKKLGEAFLANPSIPVLAQIIAQSERGDSFQAKNQAGALMPSEKAEAKTLLAMVMMQYPNLVINRDQVLPLLKQAESHEFASGLARALIARSYLFGDYAKKDINFFSHLAGQSETRYRVNLDYKTVFYAIEKFPDWKGRQMWLDRIAENQEIQQSFQEQRDAAKSTDVNKRAIDLMRQGERIDQLSIEALGAGPKIAEIRAKGEMLRKEGSGEANLIKVEVYQSDEYRKLVEQLISAKPKLTEEAKDKLAKANKLKLESIANFLSIRKELVLQFFSLDIGGAAENGSLINAYYNISCKVGVIQIELAKQVGIPAPVIDSAKLAKDKL